jgi:hypothetical protein
MAARCDDEGGASGASEQVAVLVAPNLVCCAGGPACECARLRVLFGTDARVASLRALDA